MCPKWCELSEGLKQKDLAKHAEVCPLEMVLCPFSEAGCGIEILRKDLSAHMESSTQQHLMVMMTAYGKLHSEHKNLKEEFKQLSSQVTSLTFVEPVKLTNTSNTFSFYITLSKGWSSPPFCVQDGYTFCIKHKEGRIASLMLLKGKNEDNLKWPINLQYRLEILIERPHGESFTVRQQNTTQILNLDLSAKIKRVAKDNDSTEV